MAFGVANDPLQAVLDADAALRMVETTDDPARAGYLLIHREMASALAGHGVAWDRLDEGIRLEGGGQVPGRGPSSPPLVLFTMCDKPDEARARFVVDDRWYASRGEEGWQAERAGQLALVELRAGNTDAARSLANDACERLDRLQVGGGWPLVYAWRSLVDAHTGRAGRALETTAGLLEDLGSTLWTAIVHSVAVFASHAQGDEPRALEHAVRMRAILESLGIADLLADRSEPVLAGCARPPVTSPVRRTSSSAWSNGTRRCRVRGPRQPSRGREPLLWLPEGTSTERLPRSRRPMRWHRRSRMKPPGTSSLMAGSSDESATSARRQPCCRRHGQRSGAWARRTGSRWRTPSSPGLACVGVRPTS